MSRPYYDPEHLERFGEIGEHRPDLWEAYQSWSQRTFAEGALPTKTKHLIALAVAHALQCPYCIEAHTKGALSAGAEDAEVVEAIHVAAVIRGGAALVHGLQALDTLDDA